MRCPQCGQMTVNWDPYFQKMRCFRVECPWFGPANRRWVDYRPKHTVPCPKCGARAPYEVVDNGVGEEQCGPATCDCGWVQDYISEFDE